MAQAPNPEGEFSTLADALKSPKRVKTLTIENGDPDIERIAELRNCENLEKLVLHRAGLSEFPDLSNLSRLTYLDLSYNEFERVPLSIAKMKALESFSMFANRLTELPAEIGALQNLQFLFVGQNPDLDVSDAVVKLKPLGKLTHLGFGGIRMAVLPDAIGELKSLKLLWIANTGLTSLPESFSGLTNLESLVLKGCELETLPKAVERLPRLKEIVLEGNPMSEAEFDRIAKARPEWKIYR